MKNIIEEKANDSGFHKASNMNLWIKENGNTITVCNDIYTALKEEGQIEEIEVKAVGQR